MKRAKGIMKWDMYTKIIDEIAERDPSTRVWMTFFGEGLMLKKKEPSLFDMVAYAKKKGLQSVVLNSNGVLLDKESSRQLIDCGLDGIYVGIDAFSKETYDQVRVGGNYEKVVQNMLDLLEIKKEKKAENFHIVVQFVEMDINADEKQSFIDFWSSKGIDVKIRQRVSWAGLVEDEEGKNVPEERHICYWLLNSISITDTGDVATCAADPEARYIAGNVENQTIQEIWDGKLGDLRNLHITNQWDKLPHPCDKCTDWQVSYEDRIIAKTEPPTLLRKLKSLAKRAVGLFRSEE